ncbi:MAG: NADH-quinone oxidoreductase subunit C [Proteobacteria bacterium]|nr:NADH-quinone oxidoreductase subunit C [Pseudomonadota bacterium]
MPEIDTSLLENKLPGFSKEFSGDILEVQDYRGDLTVVLSPKALRKALSFFKTQLSFEILMDIFAMDYSKFEPAPPERFSVIYNLYSLSRKRRVRLKLFLKEDGPEVESVHDLYASANWFEREAWDLFGIQFLGHPHLTRILCHNEFEGHPLRKDYPSDGYQQLRRASASLGL